MTNEMSDADLECVVGGLVKIVTADAGATVERGAVTASLLTANLERLRAMGAHRSATN